MSKRSFKVARHVWGELSTRSGAAPFDIEPGTVTPGSAAEEAVLLHLVGLGRAEIVTPARPAKKKEA